LTAVTSSIKASLHSSTQFLTAAKTSIVSILPLLSESKKATGLGRIVFTAGMNNLIKVGIDIGVSVAVGATASLLSDGAGVGVEVGAEAEVGVGVEVMVGVGVEVGAMQAEVSRSQAMSQLKFPLA